MTREDKASHLFLGAITVAAFASMLAATAVLMPSTIDATSITGTPGGGEILLRPGETAEPFCFVIGQITTSGTDTDAQGRGRMYFARTCDEKVEGKYDRR